MEVDVRMAGRRGRRCLYIYIYIYIYIEGEDPGCDTHTIDLKISQMNRCVSQ